MQRLIIVAGLEAYALLLAWMQGGIRTDEAKYLLSIPYPHPPLARWFLSLFDGFAWQVGAARILFATLVVQAAWIVWKIGKDMPRANRLVLCGSWLFSWGVLSQAGAVMMAPLTALQGLVFLWLYVRDEDTTPFAGIVALFWLASLFTAYQIALFFPVVLALFRRMRLSAWQRLALFLIPVFLIGLYTLTNPFALASMLNQAGKDGGVPLFERIHSVLWLWFVSGSAALSVAGTIGLFRPIRWPVFASFALVCAYVLAGFHGYYVILFVPFLIVGLSTFLRLRPLWSVPYAVSLLIVSGLLFTTSFVWPAPSVAHDAMRLIEARGRQGSVLIQGSFGHEWQYESPYPVLKYGEWLLEGAQAVVCLKEDACDVRGNEGFQKMEGSPVEVWMRK